jgi:myo-inositol-1-phosphate synthase
MSNDRIGIWLIGACGGVASTAITGLLALQKGLTGSTGLVSDLPLFSHLELPDWGQFVVGGHEIRDVSLADEAGRLHTESRVLDAKLLDLLHDDYIRFGQNIRPGTLWNSGEAIRQLAGNNLPEHETSCRQVVERLQRDLREFQLQHQLADVIVVNVASTEATSTETQKWPETWIETETILDRTDCQLPASSLYAIAALDLGFPYINFTPSLGSTPAGIDQLALLRETCHAGRDGKTGETLLKSVLAPMFVARNLEVMSWVGHNIFGNLDGKVLENPENKATKVRSKDQLLGAIFGYSPQTLVSIEHIKSLGDWKTAWDHIHFQGFLGTPMTLQFIWQGSDSLLAAPLVLDLIRFARVARLRGEVGPLTFLSSFFKSPLAMDQHAFHEQQRLLIDWARN